MPIPRLVISGLSGGSGKTMLSLGLARVFARQQRKVLACKKGPDYIDAAWLARAARAPQCNLDPFFSSAPQLAAIFARAAEGRDLAIIEGNRGLFDGLDLEGTCSTAQVARILNAPVLLVVDCTKMTRTAAALVKGCLDFEPGLRIGGVILNRTGNNRHRDLARRAVEELAGVPVLGALPRQGEPFLLERHMGLAGTDESLPEAKAEALLDALADFVAANVNLDAVAALAAVGAEQSPAEERQKEHCRPARPLRPRIGYVFDAALWFYYRENLDALEDAGARALPLSLLDPAPWPEVDGLYLGGGLPELHAEALCANRAGLERLAALSAAGLPVYAECGGFMVLCRSMAVHGAVFPMAGVFPCAVEFCSRPQGLGYVEAEAVADNPFHPRGARFRGHEFHFSRRLAGQEPATPEPENTILRLSRGRGMGLDATGTGRDGLLTGNTFASYTHIYAPAVPHWAPAFVRASRSAGGTGGCPGRVRGA